MKLVLDLEQKALNKTISITDLLRTALTVAVKLNALDFEKWINNELNGYQNIKDTMIPSYRFIDGVAKYHNPFHGWCDVVWATQEQYNDLKHIAIHEKISEIEAFTLFDGVLSRDFSVDVQKQFLEDAHGLIPKIIFGKHQFIGILDSVKTKILQWALDLERKGIVGEDMTFNENEQRAAEHITINNYIRHAEYSNFQQGVTNSMNIESNNGDNINLIKSFLEELKEISTKIEDLADRNEINADISTIEQQLKSPNPKINIIHELLKSIRTIIEGAGGNLISSYPAIENGFRSILG